MARIVLTGVVSEVVLPTLLLKAVQSVKDKAPLVVEDAVGIEICGDVPPDEAKGADAVTAVTPPPPPPPDEGGTMNPIVNPPMRKMIFPPPSK